jgi:hypothetical protein
LSVKQRHQRHGAMRRINRKEGLVAPTLGKGYARHRGAEARKKRDLQVAGELERAARALFCDPLDFALVSVGIERHGEDRRRGDHEPDRSEDAN